MDSSSSKKPKCQVQTQTHTHQEIVLIRRDVTIDQIKQDIEPAWLENTQLKTKALKNIN